jgi:hypothetical protein
MMRHGLWIGVALVLVAACRDRASPSSSPPGTSAASAPSSRSTAPSAPSSGTPSPDSACTRDDECAVARIAVAGKYACCPACETTPGTRRWHATLQRHCAAQPPTDCFPLACPQGPTRAVCREGRCEATADGPDGGPAFVQVERRCLPALVCDSWAGCTLAIGNAQDGWFVHESERASRGEIVGLARVATTDGGVAEAFRLSPRDVKCLPHGVPPVLSPPPSCKEVDGHCRPAGGS